MKKPAAVSGRWFPFPLLLTRGRHPQRRSSWKNPCAAHIPSARIDGDFRKKFDYFADF
jgi:hypothetical protein